MNNKDKYLIGEKVKVQNVKETGVVTRIDEKLGLIYVLFNRMNEQMYPYPEALDQQIIIPLVHKK